MRVAAALALCACAVAPAAHAADRVVAQHQPGFFEVSGPDLAWVHAVDSRAAEARAGLAMLIDLPARYPTPVYVRMRAVDPAGGEGVFRLGIEPAGLVTLAIEPGLLTGDAAVRRALVRALLVRHAAWMGGYSADLRVPAWIEEAGVTASLVAAQPAMAEALGREAARHGPLPMAALLSGGSIEGLPGWPANAWLLAQFFRDGLGRDAWQAFLRESLRGGDDSSVAVSRTLGRGGANPEVAWAAGFFNLAARHGGPGQSPQESHRAVTRAARFVFRAGGRDTVFPWERLWFWREDEAVRREAETRARLLASQAATAHPFFVNAFASLQEALQALLDADAGAFGPALARYDEDLAEAVEMTFKADAILDGDSNVP